MSTRRQIICFSLPRCIGYSVCLSTSDVYSLELQRHLHGIVEQRANDQWAHPWQKTLQLPHTERPQKEWLCISLLLLWIARPSSVAGCSRCLRGCGSPCFHSCFLPIFRADNESWTVPGGVINCAFKAGYFWTPRPPIESPRWTLCCFPMPPQQTAHCCVR